MSTRSQTPQLPSKFTQNSLSSSQESQPTINVSQSYTPQLEISIKLKRFSKTSASLSSQTTLSSRNLKVRSPYPRSTNNIPPLPRRQACRRKSTSLPPAESHNPRRNKRSESDSLKTSTLKTPVTRLTQRDGSQNGNAKTSKRRKVQLSTQELKAQLLQRRITLPPPKPSQSPTQPPIRKQQKTKSLTTRRRRINDSISSQSSTHPSYISCTSCRSTQSIHPSLTSLLLLLLTHNRRSCLIANLPSRVDI